MPLDEVAGRHRERAVDAVAAAVRADHVALAAVGGAADHRLRSSSVGRAPVDGRRTGGALTGVRGQADVARAGGGIVGGMGAQLPWRGGYSKALHAAVLAQNLGPTR